MLIHPEAQEIAPPPLGQDAACPLCADPSPRALFVKRDHPGAVGAAGGPDPVICPIRNSQDLEEVYRITHDAYVREGYCLPQPDGRLIHYPRLDGIPQTTVLVAILQNRVMGTISFTMDGPHGLHADDDFRDACDAIRAEGKCLAACWRIATREQFRGEMRLVMALIRETARLVLQKGVETFLFTINPRHEGIYKKLFQMETVARQEGSIGSLRNAPAVLARLNRSANPLGLRRRR